MAKKRLISEVALLFLLSAIMLMSGCTTRPVYQAQRVPPPKPVDVRQPTQWVTETKEYCYPQFSVATTYLPESGRLVIDGKIVQCQCVARVTEVRDVPTQRYSDVQSAWLQEWTAERRVAPSETYTWIPPSVRIQNSFGRDCVASVAADGSFHAVLQGGGGIYFTKPVLSKYLSTKSSGKRTAIVIPGEAPAGLSVSTSIDLPPVFSVVADTCLAEQYVRDHIATFTMVCYDQNSRTPVMPTMQLSITDGPTLENIKETLSKEFSGNQELIQAGLTVASEVKWKGVKSTGIDQEIQFKVWQGSSIKISATHPKYYFFETNLRAETSGEIRKNILLIEKGTKVRVDNVNEGQVGTIIDQ